MFYLVYETNSSAKDAFEFKGRHYVYLKDKPFNSLALSLVEIKPLWADTSPHAKVAQVTIANADGATSVINIWQMDKSGQWIAE